MKILSIYNKTMMNKKLIIWAIALVGISTLVVQQANAAWRMGGEKHGWQENMNRSGTYTGMHLGSGRNEMRSGLKLWSGGKERFGSGMHFGSGRDEMWSGLKLWSGEREHFGSGFKLGSGFHFGSGEMMWSGEKKDFLWSGVKLNPGKKIGNIKKVNTIKKATTKKKTTKKTPKK